VQVSEPSASQNIDTGEVTVVGEARLSGQSDNSPYLRPFYANQYDISYEYYFDDSDGALIAALYYKDIQSFVDRSTTDPYDFAANGFIVPTSIDIPVFTDEDEAQPVLDELGEQVFVSVPVIDGAYTTAENNARGGYIRGLELSYTEVYSNLPGLWSGLGVSASYSYTETEIIKRASENDGVFSTLLPGLSKQVLSGTLFWENDGFETRVSARYRDPFVSKQVAVNDQVVNFDSELIIDYQASYEVNENLGILFQVNNLTDAPTKSYFGNEARTGTIQYFGTQFFLGLTYSL
jgi:TonB-dependent receptor